MITALIVLLLVLMLGWSGWRARSYGKLGVYSWFQSGTLLLPWLLFFVLGSAGVYLNLAGMLILFVSSTVAYVAIGQKVRSIAPGELAKRAEAQAHPAAVREHGVAATRSAGWGGGTAPDGQPDFDAGADRAAYAAWHRREKLDLACRFRAGGAEQGRADL